jgi:gliding motility-associated-like protein
MICETDKLVTFLFTYIKTQKKTAMRKCSARLLTCLFVFCSAACIYGQDCRTSNSNTIINFSCGVTCGPINFSVPDIRTTSDYTVNAIPYNPYSYVTSASPAIVPCASQDDKFFDTTFLPFPFCFYDSVFTKCVIGTNGVISFDMSNILRGNNWDLDPPLPIPNMGRGDVGRNNCATPTETLYPRACIMGPYVDMFPQASDRFYKIEMRTEGMAPCRKFIVSFSQVPLFNCPTSRVTSQMVLYETTGLIDIFVENKPQCSFNGNNGIIAIQDWTRTKGIPAPSRDAGSWIAQNEAYRFTPAGSTSRFVSSQLFTLGGTLVGAGIASNSTPGVIDLTFPNVCPSSSTQQFIVRTTYRSCNSPVATISFEDTLTINTSPSLGATAESTDINCVTGTLGTITVNVPRDNGIPPYKYSINGGPSQISNIFTGLNVGNYSVFVTDANGCNSTMNVDIIKTGNLAIAYSSNNTSCLGVSDGSISVFPPSIHAPLQYTFNGGPPQTNNIFSGLPAGSYTIAASDAIGCTGSATVVITQEIGVTATFVTAPPTCSGSSNGSITVTTTSGTAPYSYSINGGPQQTSNIFTGLTNGTHNIRIRDANGCARIYAVVLNPAMSLNATVSKTDVSCNGASNGSITISMLNGSTPYQYSLNNTTWQTGNTFSNLGPGNYTVYYRDNNGCFSSQTVTITQPAILDATTTSTNPRCFGHSDGIILVNAIGGLSPYQYSLNGFNYQFSNQFGNLIAGSFTIYVKDANGCIKTQTATLTQPSILTGTATTISATCNGGEDGQISITANGGTAPYYYILLGGQQAQPLTTIHVVPGSYNITLIDANMCVTNVPAVVGLSNNLSIIPAPDVTICEGNTTQLNVTTNATQFSWTQAGSLNNAGIQNPLASPAVTTEYILTANYGICSANDTIIVNVNPAPKADAGTDTEICFGQDLTLRGSGGSQFMWSPSSTLSNASLNDPLATPQQTTTYSLDVIDDNGCKSITPDQVIVTVTPPIVVQTFPSDTIVFGGDQFQIIATSGASNYSWSPAIGLSNPFVSNPILTATTDLSLRVTASTPAGCSGEGTVSVKVFKGPEIYMPTGFTPNNDGRNDKFKPFTVGIVNINYFRVYSRWGQLLFSTNKMNDGWDGRINGIDQPTGTFVWMVQGVARDGKVITKKGTVTLIR